MVYHRFPTPNRIARFLTLAWLGTKKEGSGSAAAPSTQGQPEEEGKDEGVAAACRLRNGVWEPSVPSAELNMGRS